MTMWQWGFLAGFFVCRLLAFLRYELPELRKHF